jgi:adenylate cyclase
MRGTGMGDAAGDIREELTEGLEGDARAARLALVDDLLARGCTPEELRSAHGQGRLTMLPLELVLPHEGNQTMAEIASRYDVRLDDLERTRRAIGLPADREAPIYGDELSRHAERLSAALDLGVPIDALVELNRVIGRSLAAVVASGRDAIARMLGPGAELDEHTQATGIATAVERLMPMMRDVVQYALAEHTRELIRNTQAEALALASGDADVREVAVAFADLVGFTSMGDDLEPREVSQVAARLEALAGDSLRPGVTLVKTIGDEVMLASPDAPALAESVLALIAAADDPANDLPRLRAGAAAGPAVQRAGDWYGATVNLASRLTTLAQPGTLLSDAAFRERAGDANGAGAWSSAGERQVRGVNQAVATYVATAG